MPFSVLVQKQFTLRAISRGYDAIMNGQRRMITLNSTKKRRTMDGGTVITGGNQLEVQTPQWINHLNSFRCRSFCSSAPTNLPKSTNLLQSTTRSTTSNHILHHQILSTATPTNVSNIQARQCKTSAQYIQDIEELCQGNQTFRKQTLSSHPKFFEESAKGQKPPYMLIDCSDSRVAEQAIFDAQPGTMFTSGSIANQFHEWDLNSNSVLSYAVETLGVRHVVVMGHYGCGGVAAAMLPVSLPLEHPAHIAVQTWIQPIREIYQTSTRDEIVAHRDKYKSELLTQLPDLHDPAFRAMVEENVKTNVNRIAASYVMRDHYASLALPDSTTEREPPSLKRTHVFIHGWVYDLENGEVTDLNVTVGPPGRQIPSSPWPSTYVREKEKREEREARFGK